MEMNDYQEKAATTAIYPKEARLVYPLLGLLGEAGEMAEKVKDALFPGGVSPDSEILDIYWLLDNLAMAGHQAEQKKKLIRDSGKYPQACLEEMRRRVDSIPQGEISKLEKEVGDALWYVSNIARDLKVSLEDVAGGNLEKLQSRKERGVLQGSGDNR